VTVKLHPTPDDPTVLEVIADGRKLGEVAPLLKRWQIINPFEPRTYETLEQAVEALRGK